jgi:hypothetical protein
MEGEIDFSCGEKPGEMRRAASFRGRRAGGRSDGDLMGHRQDHGLDLRQRGVDLSIESGFLGLERAQGFDPLFDFGFIGPAGD